MSYGCMALASLFPHIRPTVPDIGLFSSQVRKGGSDRTYCRLFHPMKALFLPPSIEVFRLHWMSILDDTSSSRSDLTYDYVFSVGAVSPRQKRAAIFRVKPTGCNHDAVETTALLPCRRYKY